MHSSYLHICIGNCIMIGSEEIVQQEHEEQEIELYHLGVDLEGATEGEGSITELPECLEHYPTTSVKGNP